MVVHGVCVLHAKIIVNKSPTTEEVKNKLVLVLPIVQDFSTLEPILSKKKSTFIFNLCCTSA